MKKVILLVVCFVLLASAYARWHPPKEKPAIDVLKAIVMAKEFASSDGIDLKDYYIDRVWCGVFKGESKRVWVVSFSSPSKGFYFLSIYMNGQIENPIKEGKDLPWRSQPIGQDS